MHTKIRYEIEWPSHVEHDASGSMILGDVEFTVEYRATLPAARALARRRCQRADPKVAYVTPEVYRGPEGCEDDDWRWTRDLKRREEIAA